MHLDKYGTASTTIQSKTLRLYPMVSTTMPFFSSYSAPEPNGPVELNSGWLFSSYCPRSVRVMKGKPLTPREREVLQLVWDGLSTRDIARQLGRSYNTISLYRQRIRAKFGVTTTAAALTIARERGMIKTKRETGK